MEDHGHDVEYPTPTPDVPGDAGVPEAPNEDVRDDPVPDDIEAPDEPAQEEGNP